MSEEQARSLLKAAEAIVDQLAHTDWGWQDTNVRALVHAIREAGGYAPAWIAGSTASERERMEASQ